MRSGINQFQPTSEQIESAANSSSSTPSHKTDDSMIEIKQVQRTVETSVAVDKVPMKHWFCVELTGLEGR